MQSGFSSRTYSPVVSRTPRLTPGCESLDCRNREEPHAPGTAGRQAFELLRLRLVVDDHDVGR